MRGARLACALATGLFATALRTAPAQDPPAHGASPERILGWIQALGAELYEEREAADAFLRGCGPEALAPLYRAASHPDLEVSTRAEAIVRHIRLEERIRAWSVRAAADPGWVPDTADAVEPEPLAREAAAEGVELPGNWRDVDARLCLALCASPDRVLAQRMQQRLGAEHAEAAARRLDRAVASGDWPFVQGVIHTWSSVSRIPDLARGFLPALRDGPPNLRAQILYAIPGWNLPPEEKLEAVTPLLADVSDAWIMNEVRLRVCDLALYAAARVAGQPRDLPGPANSVDERDADLARWRVWAGENRGRPYPEWSAPPSPPEPTAGGTESAAE